MKKVLFLIFVTLPLFFISCSDEENIENENYIYLDVSISGERLYYDLSLYGTNTTVDWGDGIIQDFELSMSSVTFKEPRHYYEKEGIYRIKFKTDNIISASFSDAYYNESFIQNISLGKCPLLESIYFSRLENIHTIDLKNCPQLKMVSIRNLPSLSSLDISKNPYLLGLDCEYNSNLLYLDISNNAKLYTISCFNNGISSIKMKNNNDLRHVILPYNNIETKELDQIFTNLPTAGVPVTEDEYTIGFIGNPGTATCDSKIITDKGWTITY